MGSSCITMGSGSSTYRLLDHRRLGAAAEDQDSEHQ